MANHKIRSFRWLEVSSRWLKVLWEEFETPTPDDDS